MWAAKVTLSLESLIPPAEHTMPHRPCEPPWRFLDRTVATVPPPPESEVTQQPFSSKVFGSSVLPSWQSTFHPQGYDLWMTADTAEDDELYDQHLHIDPHMIHRLLLQKSLPFGGVQMPSYPFKEVVTEMLLNMENIDPTIPYSDVSMFTDGSGPHTRQTEPMKGLEVDEAWAMAIFVHQQITMRRKY